MNFELILYLSVALLTAYITGIIARWARHRNVILAWPNARSSHTVPTPSGGGLAIAISFWLGLIVLWATNRLEPELFTAVLGGSLILVAVGIIDDSFGVKPGWRLLCQVIAVIWALHWLNGIILSDWSVMEGLKSLLVVFALVWLINLYNFMDGIDGLAASETIYFALVSILLIEGQAEPVLALMASACAGFLLLNWPPARIFMGDSGSYLLGYTVGIYGLGAVKTDPLRGWTLLILLAVFLVDATYTLLCRIIYRARWYEPHRSHAYQKAARRLGGHAPVTGAVLVFNILWLLPWAWLSVRVPEWGAGFLLLAIAPLILFASRLRAGREGDTKIY